EGMPSLLVLTLWDRAALQPLAFMRRMGNLGDAAGMRRALGKLAWMGYDKLQVVADAEDHLSSAAAAFVRDGMKFLLLAQPDDPWVDEAMREHREELLQPVNRCPWDDEVQGLAVMVTKTLHWRRRRSGLELRKGEIESRETRLYVHIYFNRRRYQAERKHLTEQLAYLCREIEGGVSPKDFGAGARERAERFIRAATQPDGRVTAEVNEAAWARAERVFGFVALVSNKKMSPFEALAVYRHRQGLGEAFRFGRGATDAHCKRIWDANALKGRMFCQFIALCYRHAFEAALARARARLASDPEPEGLQARQLRAGLAQWLAGCSPQQVLDWLDGNELGGSSPEPARDRLLMRLLAEELRGLMPAQA
ncbi:MAG: hypothetical protein HUK26_01915, partial [Duodenibacillus sp.]|nr:hypothetical protein [Duodenibacillus sp.]